MHFSKNKVAMYIQPCILDLENTEEVLTQDLLLLEASAYGISVHKSKITCQGITEEE